MAARRGKEEQAFTLVSSDGKNLPLQTWPLAYWPDGSMKWSGFATVAGAQSSTGTVGFKATGELKLEQRAMPAWLSRSGRVTRALRLTPGD